MKGPKTLRDKKRNAFRKVLATVHLSSVIGNFGKEAPPDEAATRENSSGMHLDQDVVGNADLRAAVSRYWRLTHQDDTGACLVSI
jgi:hypothetical protein